MNSKDYEKLVRRLQIEIERNREHVRICELSQNLKERDVALEYIKYHEEMIRFIKKIDGEGVKTNVK